MLLFYDLGVYLSWFILKFIALFNPKIRQFTGGRKQVMPYLRKERDPGKKLIWMHTASLGEFEQGLPVLERLQSAFPDHQLLVTFFSPSGYEVKKNSLQPHLVTYLPMDTRRNARTFLEVVRPEIALFVKYEVWPGFFREMQRQEVPLLMISAIYRSRQAYFKWYGGLLRKALKRVTHFYVQDALSMELLETLGIRQVSVTGDTRFDRVLQIGSSVKELPFMEEFKQGRTCLVAGSTWPEDHELLVPFVNDTDKDYCFVIATHNIDPKTIENLRRQLTVPVVLYSELELASPKEARVLILDTIGLLTRVYKYGELAYVGGGFATGLHNTLEPAVYGIPVLIGPDYSSFREAEDLVAAGGISVVNNPAEFRERAGLLMASPELCDEMGSINTAYLNRNAGASDKILAGVEAMLR